MVNPKDKIAISFITSITGDTVDIHLYKGPGIVATAWTHLANLSNWEKLKKFIEQYPKEKNQAKRILLIKAVPRDLELIGKGNINANGRLLSQNIVKYVTNLYPLGK